MDKSNTRANGINGENVAARYLVKNGFCIVEKNYRYKHCEIDIIVKKDNCIHFVEVKYRKNNNFGYPESFVSNDQKARIKLAAEDYIYKTKWSEKIAFDIISIEKTKSDFKILFFEDSF